MTYEEAILWIAEIFEEEPEDSLGSKTRKEIEAWDSLGMLTLISGLFEDFDITLSDDEVNQLETVKDILDILKKHTKLD